jgi:hypothetical protein
MAINTGKVITGGLLAGVVFNILDFANNALVLGEDFRANATRLSLDPAAAETPAAIATWVVIDFLLGILTVFVYAAIRPRFGAGVKTAIYASLIPFSAIALIVFGFTTVGMFPMALFWKGTIASALICSIGGIAGAWAYRES